PGRRARRPDGYALSKRRSAARTRHLQSGQPLGPGAGDQYGVGVAALPTEESAGALVPEAIWKGQQSHSQNWDCRVGAKAIDRVLALSRSRHAAGGRDATRITASSVPRVSSTSGGSGSPLPSGLKGE